MTIKEAVILAGGVGSRLRPLTLSTPKPLLPIGGKAFLDYLIWNLSRHGVEKIYLTTGYLAEKIEAYYSKNPFQDVQIFCVEETAPLGTGGGLKKLQHQLGEYFYVLNGDSIFDANYAKLASTLIQTSCDAVLALRQLNDTSRYGRITLEGNLIKSFDEKSSSEQKGTINGGVYALRKSALTHLPEGKSSLEYDLFSKLALANRLQGIVFNNYFIDIGTLETFRLAQKEIPEWYSRAAIFY